MAFREKPPYLDPAEIQFEKSYGYFWTFTQGDSGKITQTNVRLSTEWHELLCDFAEQVGMNKADFARSLIYDGIMVYAEMADGKGHLPDDLIARARDARVSAEIDEQERRIGRLRTQLGTTKYILDTLPEGANDQELLNSWRNRLYAATPLERAMIEEALGQWL